MQIIREIEKTIARTVQIQAHNIKTYGATNIFAHDHADPGFFSKKKKRGGGYDR